VELAWLRSGIEKAVADHATIATAASANLFIATSIILIAAVYRNFDRQQQDVLSRPTDR
jgi:hypothetical protein